MATKEEHAAYMRVWKARHPEKKIEYAEKHKAANRRWSRKHKKQCKAYRKIYKLNNAEKLQEQQAAYYQSHKDIINARSIAYYKQNREALD